MKLSIIIPIYNMERYLKKCLESIFNNKKINYDFEVICINDGSTDLSLEILKAFRKTNSDKMKIVNINNSGVSTARNIGIKEANGEYITFIDSDDWISDDFLQCIFTALNEEPECELFIFNTNLVKKEVFANKEEINDTVFNTENHACGKVFKKEVVSKNKIEFPPNIKLGEDMVFTFKYILMISKIKYVNKNIYYYRCNREGSTMSTQINTLYRQIFDACDELYNYSIDSNKICIFKDELEYLFVKNIIIRNTLKVLRSKKMLKEILKELDEEIVYINEKFPGWSENKYIIQDADRYCSKKLGHFFKDVLINFRNKRYILVIYYYLKGKMKMR